MLPPNDASYIIGGGLDSLANNDLLSLADCTTEAWLILTMGGVLCDCRKDSGNGEAVRYCEADLIREEVREICET